MHCPPPSSPDGFPTGRKVRFTGSPASATPSSPDPIIGTEANGSSAAPNQQQPPAAAAQAFRPPLEQTRQQLRPVPPVPLSSPPEGVHPNAGIPTATAHEILKETTLSPETFTAFIPTFFVPVDELLADMPGYTLAHINRIMGPTRSIQIVSLDNGNTNYIRCHGRPTFSMTQCGVANEKWKRYEPRPELARPFFVWFKKPGDTVKLADLMERMGKAVEATLPFQGKAALLYFAQLAHLFAFSPLDGGSVTRPAVRPSLDEVTSPCPATCNEVYRMVKEAPLDLTRIGSAASPEAIRQLQLFYPNWRSFVTQHDKILHMEDKADIISTRDYKIKSDLEHADIDDQIRHYMANRDSKKAKRLMKKKVVGMNPENPLLEHSALAKAVADLLPREGYVNVRKFYFALPSDMQALLPHRYHDWFRRHPEHFTMFELGTANNFTLTRPGNKLPENVLRQTFSIEDIIALYVDILRKQTDQSWSAGRVLQALPQAARDIINKQYGGPVTPIARYTEYFSILHRKPGEPLNDSSTLITLIKVPAFVKDVRGGGGK